MTRQLPFFLLIFLATVVRATDFATYYAGKMGNRRIEMTLFDCDTNKVIVGYQHIFGENKLTSLQGINEGGSLNLYEVKYNSASRQWDTIGVYQGDYSRENSFDGVWQSFDKKSKIQFNFKPGNFNQGVRVVFNSDDANRIFRDSIGDTIYSFISHIEFPKFAGGEDVLINRAMFEYVRPNDSVEYPNYDGLADAWLEGYHDFSDTSFIYEYDSPRTEDYYSSCGMIWNGSGVVCIDVSYYEYAGGAHGNSAGQSYCFNLKTGKQITLEDIFLNGYDTVLNQLTDSILGPEAERSPVNFNDDFSVSPEGISFNYDPYEIASYAGGSFFAFIPWSRLNAWIDPKGPMAWVKK